MAITSALTYTHTTETLIKDLYGESGYDALLDKLETTAARERFVGNIIDQATTTVDMYLWERYDQADYTSLPWVQDRCTWIACYLLSMRIGNPAEFIRLYEQAINDLAMIKSGEFSIPDLALADNNLPSMSNITVDDWYHRARARVDPVTSVGETYSQQHIQHTTWFEWL